MGMLCVDSLGLDSSVVSLDSCERDLSLLVMVEALL